jgi:CRP/FNR family transcriptional regulator, cyclic AMP receptor protein
MALRSDTRLPPISDARLAERTADLLRIPQTLLPLAPDEAAQVVAQMGLVAFGPGATVLREGDGAQADYLLLILEGEVEVATRGGGPIEMPIAVLAAGSVIGEMSLFDGEPRSATCVARSHVLAAALTRPALERLIDAHPRTAAKLLMGLAQRLAERLRALGEQLQIYARLTDTEPGRLP